MEFCESDVASYGFRCVTLQSDNSLATQPCALDLAGKSFLIVQTDVFLCHPNYHKKTRRYDRFEIPYPLRWIYPIIHIVTDKNGREIARRHGRGQPLLQNPRINVKKETVIRWSQAQSLQNQC